MDKVYILGESLTELKECHSELIANGVKEREIHLLTETTNPPITPLNEFSRTDVFHSMQQFSIIGVVLAIIFFLVAWYLGWLAEHPILIPIISVGIVSFMTWEGGFIGIQKMQHQLVRFKNSLKNGKHVLIVDHVSLEDKGLSDIQHHHPRFSFYRSP